MKKLLIALFFLILFCFAGCAKNDKLEQPASFYYLKTDIAYGTESGVFSSEERECKGLSTEEIIGLYLKGPVTEGLKSPFPFNTTLVTLQITESEISVTLSDEYAELTGLSLAEANACICQTLINFTGAERVIISCETKALNGEARFEFTKADMILIDDSIEHADVTSAKESTSN